MIMTWIIGFHSAAPGTRQCNVLQAVSNAATGLQVVKLPLHIADNNSCDLGFQFAGLHTVTTQLQLVQNFSARNTQIGKLLMKHIAVDNLESGVLMA